MPLNFPPIPRQGTTPARKRFWDDVRATVIAAQKIAGRNVTTDEHPGKGTVINIAETRARRPSGGGGTGACCYDDETCDDLTEADCTETGGTYQGDGIPCDPNPCGSIPIFFAFRDGGTHCGVCTGGVELDWGLGITVSVNTFEYHASGVFTDYDPDGGTYITCLISGIPTQCTNGTWTLDWAYDPDSNTFDISATITIPPCGDCCGFTHTVTRTGVTYTGTSQDLGETSMGTDCGFDIGGFDLFVNGP